MTLLLFIVIVGLGIYFFLYRRKSQSELNGLRSILTEANAAKDRLRAENEALGKYRVIQDAKAEAERILSEAGHNVEVSERAANAIRERATREANESILKAEEEAKTVRAQANQALKSAQDRVESIMVSAHLEAKSIVEGATKRGEEIAGSAFDALRNAE